MKIKSTIISMLLFAAFLGFQSCSDELEKITGCAGFQNDYTSILDASMAFSENPTTETCQNYKNALSEFYDDYNDCPFWGDVYQDTYDEAQALDCSEVEAE